LILSTFSTPCICRHFDMMGNLLFCIVEFGEELGTKQDPYSHVSIQPETTDTALGARRWFPSSFQHIRCSVMMLSARWPKSSVRRTSPRQPRERRPHRPSRRRPQAPSSSSPNRRSSERYRARGRPVPARRVRPASTRSTGSRAAARRSSGSGLDARLPARSRLTELPAARRSLGA
jgi:hypothetical protein